MTWQYEKIMLLVAKKWTNLLMFSLFLLTVHHPRKTAQTVENYSFPIRETNHSSLVFISEWVHVTRKEKCQQDLEVAQCDWKEVKTWHGCKPRRVSEGCSRLHDWSARQGICRPRSAQGHGTSADGFRNGPDNAHLVGSGDNDIKRWQRGPKTGSQLVPEILWVAAF